MRRILLPAVLIALTGTLVAQTPTPPKMPLTQPNYFNATVSSTSMHMDGDKLILKGVRVEFDLGVTVTADELTYDKSVAQTMNLAGNVKMTLKKK